MGVQLRWWGDEGVSTALRLEPPPQKGSIDGSPKILPRLTSRAPEVTRTRKNENGIFGISASRGFREVFICHGFGGKEIDYFQCSKKLFRGFSARVRNN